MSFCFQKEKALRNVDTINNSTHKVECLLCVFVSACQLSEKRLSLAVWPESTDSVILPMFDQADRRPLFWSGWLNLSYWVLVGRKSTFLSVRYTNDGFF